MDAGKTGIAAETWQGPGWYTVAWTTAAGMAASTSLYETPAELEADLERGCTARFAGDDKVAETVD